VIDVQTQAEHDAEYASGATRGGGGAGEVVDRTRNRRCIRARPTS